MPDAITASARRVATPLCVLVALVQVVAWVVAAGRQELGFVSARAFLVEVVVSLLLLVIGVHAWNQWLPARRAGRRTGNAVLVAAYLVLIAATLTLGHPPDFAIVADHFGLLVYPSSFMVLAGAMQIRVGAAALAAIVAIGVAERKADLLTRDWPRRTLRRAAFVGTCWAAMVLAVWWLQIRTHDAPSRFLTSALEYAFLRAPAVDDAAAPAADPVRDFVPSFPSPRRAHVFVVMMESFNALWLDRTAPDGRAIVPVASRIRDEGLSVDYFYGNSIHTARGVVSTLCSVLPSLHRPVASYPGLNLRCLPEILAGEGYATYFFHNSSSLERERMGAFLRDNGVERAFALDDGLVDPVRDEAVLWGFDRTMQDDVFFERVFERLDADRSAGVFGDAPGSPVFVTVKPGSHHLWFDWVPERERHVYRRPRDRAERFAMSLNTADRYLATFFEQLASRAWARDALVVLLGDHGFPAGERGSYTNAMGAWEENFRTPLVLWSPGWLPARRISDRAHSQLDVMPTVLDLLGVRARTHLAGESIVAEEPGELRPELLLQPYDGRQLVSLQLPYKLVLRLDTGRERLFHLLADPGEEHDLLADPVEPRAREVAGRLRPALRGFFDNQLRIRLNSLLPG